MHLLPVSRSPRRPAGHRPRPLLVSWPSRKSASQRQPLLLVSRLSDDLPSPYRPGRRSRCLPAHHHCLVTVRSHTMSRPHLNFWNLSRSGAVYSLVPMRSASLWSKSAATTTTTSAPLCNQKKATTPTVYQQPRSTPSRSALSRPDSLHHLHRSNQLCTHRPSLSLIPLPVIACSKAIPLASVMSFANLAAQKVSPTTRVS